MTDLIGRPLVFGDREQIAALKAAEARAAYRELPACDECEGNPVCDSCQRECEQCDGTGKDQAALTEWREKFPCRSCQ